MKKIIITGGSRGIGRACVELFSENDCAVAFIYRDNDDAADDCALETGAYAIKADISDPVEAEWAYKKAVEYLGGVDVLVNNAGISVSGLVTDMTDPSWRRVIDTNLSSAFYMSRAATKDFVRQQSGAIVNIGSVWGRCGASCEVAYSSSKAALRGLTLSLAKELGPSGIRVNCVEPGVIDTDMNACYDDDDIAALCEDTPLYRIGDPAEVAELVYFLASEKASFITAQIIGVDGGFGI
ncbi:MAG: SDR family oxidoreductase [Clostridia bacterium]|jgi:3-oxoacyl-[acyl-carrier protein] reductase|nr:SDR family oxidoreductase [Clostridia bacterium]